MIARADYTAQVRAIAAGADRILMLCGTEHRGPLAFVDMLADAGAVPLHRTGVARCTVDVVACEVATKPHEFSERWGPLPGHWWLLANVRPLPEVEIRLSDGMFHIDDGLLRAAAGRVERYGMADADRERRGGRRATAMAGVGLFGGG